MQPRIWALSVVTLLLSSIAGAQVPTPTPVNSNQAVTSFAQSTGNPCTGGRGTTGCGGCYPGPIPPDSSVDPIGAALAQLPLINPEWAPLGPMIPGVDASLPPDAVPVRVTGTVIDGHPSGQDFPATHVAGDFVADIVPDAADSGRLATGNPSVIGMEWERGALPQFAWAGEGDRIITVGRWIFDCGHADPQPLGTCSNDGARLCIVDSDCVSPGTCTNPTPNFTYEAEIHPPQTVVMLRNKSLPAPHAGRTAPAIPATRADVYISANGGGAGDRCTVTHLENPIDILFSKDCFKNHCSVTTGRSCKVDRDCAVHETCIVLDPAARLANINAANFEFDLPLPPPPAGSATLQIKTKDFKPLGGLMPKATFQPTPGPTPNLHVIVPMAAPLANGKLPNVFAQSISAGWKEDTTSLTHVQVKLANLIINNPLKDSTPAIPKKCTNPAGGFFDQSCAKDTECPGGFCGTTGNTCYTDKSCPKTDFCQSASRCVGSFVPGWEMWGEVNGDWVQFKRLDTIGAKAPFLAPPYRKPSPLPAKIVQAYKFDEFVPPDGSIHIKLHGHSLNCLDSQFGKNIKEGLNQFGLTVGGTCLLAGSKSPGEIDVTHNGPGFGVTTPAGKPQTFSVTSTGGDAGTCALTATKLCMTDADCPGSCSVTGGPCRTDTACRHCSLAASKFCAADSDCASPQTCVSGAETCTGVDSCNVTGGAFTLEYTLAIIP
ncbi:MAG: hypothetical protein HYR72_06960 [Deltaproteobacteria bacterium]|nr:hypothetical protein [Deltaproteobacteria bacterium]MBI3387186.1 hypothetical protein [Deltaproteobacteria bacterium]